MDEKEASDLIIHKLALRGYADEKQKKIRYAITALADLYDAYAADSSLADDDNRARQIVHQSLVNQTMRDYEDTYPIQYIEKFIRKLL